MLVTCTPGSDKLLQKAKQLSCSLQIDFSDTLDKDCPCYLQYDEKGLSLSFLAEGSKPHNLHVSFTGGKSGYRLANNLTIKQPLAKAVGIKPGFRPDITDVTAGLGQDGFVLASLGSEVTLVERSKIIHALLSDGISRASEHPKTEQIIQNIKRLHHADSIEYLSRIPESEKPHTIYMDPMYPHSKKSALNKIEMRIIRSIVGDDMDSSALLEIALQAAANRVVVKRPKRAEEIDSKQRPSTCIEMKNSRFDIYLVAA